jgi:toxin-antitoxin system PIN domain toxin
VILIDANILIYAHVSSFAQHNVARDWLDQQLNASARVGLPWTSLLAFLRLVTNPRVFEQPEAIRDAWEQVHTWLTSETAWIPQPTERHADIGRISCITWRSRQPRARCSSCSIGGRARADTLLNGWRFCAISGTALAQSHRVMKTSTRTVAAPAYDSASGPRNSNDENGGGSGVRLRKRQRRSFDCSSLT